MRLTRRLTSARLGLASCGAAVTVLALVPFIGGPYYVSVLGQAIALSLFAISLDLLWGVSGILSFGHAAFFGLGAYAFALLVQTLGSPAGTWLALLAAVVVPATLALFVGGFTLAGRITGVYFAIITLAITLILAQVATSWTSLTGGLNGLYLAPGLTLAVPWGTLDITDQTAYYVLLLGLLVFVLLAAALLVRSPFGHALAAMATNSERATALGYNISLLKVVILVVAAALAGLAGALYVPITGFVNPDVVGLTLSTNVIIWVALGGRGTLLGAAAGTLIIAFLSSFLSGTVGHLWLLVLGAMLLLVVLFRPSGLLGSRAVRRFIGSA